MALVTRLLVNDAISNYVYMPGLPSTQAEGETWFCFLSVVLQCWKKQGPPEHGRGFYPAITLAPDQAWKDVLLLEFTSSLVMLRADTLC